MLETALAFASSGWGDTIPYSLGPCPSCCGPSCACSLCTLGRLLTTLHATPNGACPGLGTASRVLSGICFQNPTTPPTDGARWVSSCDVVGSDGFYYSIFFGCNDQGSGAWTCTVRCTSNTTCDPGPGFRWEIGATLVGAIDCRSPSLTFSGFTTTGALPVDCPDYASLQVIVTL